MIVLTGCSLNIVFFPKILEYSGLWPSSVFPYCQFVYTHQAGITPALQQNWQSSEKSQKNMENHVFGFFMKNIVFHIYLGIVEYRNTV